MFSTSSSTIAVNYTARCINSLKASKERHRFVVGTCSVQERNELSVIEFSEDTNQLDIIASYEHEDQVWALESSPEDEELIITSSLSSSGTKNVRLWRMPNSTSSRDIQQLSELAGFQLRDSSVFVNCIKWHHTKQQILTTDPVFLTVWSISESDTKELGSIEIAEPQRSNKNQYVPGAACWDPHSGASCIAAAGSDLRTFDTRSFDTSLVIPDAHRGPIQDVDYNPNKTHTVLSAGNDRLIKIWDLRSPKNPVKILSGHTHWVCSAKFNPFHDQLLASGGTDNGVNLWRIASCSSAPWLGSENSAEDAPEQEGKEAGDPVVSDPPDIKVRAIDQHEDSVFSIAWSPADAWMYCSLSFDGRVVLNHVPSTEKYKILL